MESRRVSADFYIYYHLIYIFEGIYIQGIDDPYIFIPPPDY